MYATSRGMTGPGLSSAADEKKRASAAQELQRTFAQARALAIGGGAYHSVCPSRDGLLCDSSGAGWASGWLLFEDIDRNGIRDEAERLVRRFDAVDEAVVITTSLPGRQAVTFSSRGDCRSSAGDITVSLRNTNSEATVLRINAVGRVRLLPG